jgi:SAM-dependent methyltransferase
LSTRFLLIFAALAALPGFAQTPKYANKLAPYVASPQRVVDRMLELSNLKPGETLFDLGCGDGRVLLTAAGKYKARAVGVEISPKLVAAANEEVKKRGLQQSVRVVQGDLLETDLAGADVVTLYLSTQFNERLRPRLERLLKPGARVVSYDYVIPGWKPVKVDTTTDRHGHGIYVYEMPPVRQ